MACLAIACPNNYGCIPLPKHRQPSSPPHHDSVHSLFNCKPTLSQQMNKPAFLLQPLGSALRKKHHAEEACHLHPEAFPQAASQPSSSPNLRRTLELPSCNPTVKPGLPCVRPQFLCVGPCVPRDSTVLKGTPSAVILPQANRPPLQCGPAVMTRHLTTTNTTPTTPFLLLFADAPHRTCLAHGPFRGDELMVALGCRFALDMFAYASARPAHPEPDPLAHDPGYAFWF